MKQLLKNIRAIPFVNLLMRILIKLLISLGVKIDTTHFIVSGIVKIKLPENESLKLFSKNEDYIPSQVYWKGYLGYEYSVAPFYYLSKNANTIIDIGANIGYYSLVASASNPESKVFAFEPVKRIVHRFEKQIRINNFKNIKIEEHIIGDKNDNVKFYIPKGDTMALAASTKKGWVKDVEEVSVASSTLDEYKTKNKLKTIDLIKMDCEFHELEVLQGMNEILRKDKPIILMEILFPESDAVKGHFNYDQSSEIENIMLENKYYFYLIKQNSIERVDKLIYNKTDRNYLFSTKKSSEVNFLHKEIAQEIQ